MSCGVLKSETFSPSENDSRVIVVEEFGKSRDVSSVSVGVEVVDSRREPEFLDIEGFESFADVASSLTVGLAESASCNFVSSGAESSSSESEEDEFESGAGIRVRRLRLALGYTRQAFADAIGCERESLDALEEGSRLPTHEEAVSICQTFATSREWLLEGRGRPFPNLMDAAHSLLLCPRSSFLRDETSSFDAQTREKTRRFVAALSVTQRRRALLFYADLVAALAFGDVALLDAARVAQNAF